MFSWRNCYQRLALINLLLQYNDSLDGHLNSVDT